MFGFETKKALLNGNLKGFAKGGICENFVAETLVKSGYTLHYYKPNAASIHSVYSSGVMLPAEQSSRLDAARHFRRVKSRRTLYLSRGGTDEGDFAYHHSGCRGGYSGRGY